ncbi:MAG: hypothetical protein ACKO3A_02615 [Opitutia bacterium]
MRSLSAALLTTLTLLQPRLVWAGGDYGGPGASGNAPDRVLRVQVEVTADFLGMTLELAIKGKDRAAVDARLEAILETLRKRFEGQEGWEARELDRTFAAPVRKNGGKSSFLSLSDDEEPKADQPVVATARYSLRGPAENGLKTVEILRAKASDLVDAKNEDERSRLGPIAYGLASAEDHRDELLDQIKEDVANAKSHLPEGEMRLEVAGLADPVQIRHLGGNRFVVWLNYRLGFISPKAEKTAK